MMKNYLELLNDYCINAVLLSMISALEPAGTDNAGTVALEGTGTLP